jgi:hypothetical protein
VATINSSTGLVTAVGAGTSLITYTVTDGVTSCFNTKTATVTVNQLPTVTAITGNSAVCIGASTTFVSASSSMQTTQSFAVAYSVRKVISTYTGFAMRVRRSTDNALLNVGFTSSGDLDTTALSTFIGANNGFVETWYDQSVNGKNMTQTNTGLQPQIVFSGTYKYIGTRPTIDFRQNKGVFNSSAATIAAAAGVIKAETTSYSEHHAILDANNRMGGLLQNGDTNFHGNKYPALLWKNGTSIANNASLSPINQSMVVSYTTALTSAGNLCVGNYDGNSAGGAVLQDHTARLHMEWRPW